MNRDFPLRVLPTCSSCNKTATRKITGETNRNGNAGRPYYFCCSGHKYVFITWDDTLGISPGNPQCWCSYYSRRNTVKGHPASDWYACCSGECSLRQNLVGPMPNSTGQEGCPTLRPITRYVMSFALTESSIDQRSASETPETPETKPHIEVNLPKCITLSGSLH